MRPSLIPDPVTIRRATSSGTTARPSPTLAIPRSDDRLAVRVGSRGDARTPIPGGPTSGDRLPSPFATRGTAFLRGALLLGGLVLLGARAVLAQTFSTFGPVPYAAGPVPEDLIVADLDLDGDLDVAVANSDAGEPPGAGTETVSVYLNSGSGYFATQTQYRVGDRPEGIAAADVDGDGALDLMTADYNSSTVSVLLGAGDGTFDPAPAGATHVPGGPRSVVARDFDGDGALDLATANYDASTVSILHGGGDGSFTLAVTLSVGKLPEAIDAGNLDGDGFPDLVTSDTADDTVTILRGNGDGTFDYAGPAPVGDRPRHVRLVDLDGDGLDDIVTADYNGSTVTVLENVGGAFAARATLSVAGGSGPVYVALGDLDGDGRLDVVVSYALSDRIGVFPGRGPFSFGPGELLLAGDGPLGIGLADFDGSGHTDIASSNALGNNLHIYLSAAGKPATLVDNGEPGTSRTGVWSVSGSPNPYGADSLFAKSASGTSYTWSASLPAPGTYSVHAWWTVASGRTTAAPYAITHDGGTTTVAANQRVAGGQWNYLGAFSFTGPTPTGTVRVDSLSSSLSTCADAVAFVPVGSVNLPPVASIGSIAPNPASAGDPISFEGRGDDADGTIVAYRWTSSIDGKLSDQASFTSTTLSAGTHEITFRVQDDDGVWSSETRASLEVDPAGGTGPTQVIDNGEAGTSFTGAWAVSGGANPYGANSLYAKNGPTYTYTFHLPAAGTYEVFAWWTEYSSRPTSAPIDVVHAGGTTTVLVNQRVDGGQWNSLGTFTFDTKATVTVRAVGTSSTCADAVGLVLRGAADRPPVAQITSIAPDAPVEGEPVEFQGTGSDPDGSVVAYSWTSSIDGNIGSAPSFTTSDLRAGTHTISFRVLDDLGVWSDAATRELVVSPGGPSPTLLLDNGDPGTSFTGSWSISGGADPWGTSSLYSRNGATYAYAFDLGGPGIYEVEAWWTTWSSRSTAVPYSILHREGETTVRVSQQTGGGTWNLLGTYTFDARALVRITAEGSATTCADAVRIRRVGDAPPVAETIVDNGGSGTSSTGSWSVSGGASPWGSDSLYARSGATYSFAAPASGQYRVYAWWTTWSSRSTSVPYAVSHRDGKTTVRVNQQASGGTWNLLGTFAFDGQALVSITAEGSATTCADAVRLVPAP